ncbi:alpha/beta hydrolase family protein [Marinicella sp. W31]|uniref:alpha/beta hydrolase family protein n=1 Tax=Marinicella sp. W31 TaxID=3023713 RepID=UPI0037570ED6
MKTRTIIYALGWLLLSVHITSTAVALIEGTDLQREIQDHLQSEHPGHFSWQDIIQEPSLVQVKLSPNGESLAYLLREKRGVSLWIMNTVSQQHEKLSHSLILTHIYWSKDSQRIYLYSPANMGYINVNDTMRQPEMFIKFDATKNETFYALDSVKDDHVLIIREIKEQGNNKEFQLVRVSITGEEQVLFSGSKRIYDHLFNAVGELEFIRMAGDTEHQIYRLKGDQLELVSSFVVVDKARMVIFDENSRELYVVAYHNADLISLHAIDVDTGKSRIVHQDPERISDLFGIVLDAQTDEVLLIHYFTDRMKTYAVHPEMESGVNVINAAFNTSVSVQANRAAPYWLVRQSGAEIGHAQYYLFHVASEQLIPILKEQRAIGKPLGSEILAKAIPVSYTASDGMLLHGYVMLPKNVDLQQAPLLVYVHGGPFNRMHGGHSPWQYLVNKGYAIFYPNFRASKGYGMQYMTAGKAQFSGRVQQDIIEGVEYLHTQGVGKAGNSAVFGHSFGGYSVLALLSKYPQLFKAGFASAAPTELLSTLFKMDQKGINRYDGVPLIDAVSILMIDLENEEQKRMMNENAPAALWENIQSPLFIWAGALDERVPITDVKDHAIKLKEAGKQVELVVDQQTGHNFHRDDLVGEQAFRFLVEDFFAIQFNKGRPEPSQKTQEYIARFKVY